MDCTDEHPRRLTRIETAEALGIPHREVVRIELMALLKLHLGLRADRQCREWAEAIGLDPGARGGEGEPW